MAAILQQAGTWPETTIKATCFLSDMKDLAAFNEVNAKHFTGKPARSCAAVRELPAEGMGREHPAANGEKGHLTPRDDIAQPPLSRSSAPSKAVMNSPSLLDSRKSRLTSENTSPRSRPGQAAGIQPPDKDVVSRCHLLLDKGPQRSSTPWRTSFSPGAIAGTAPEHRAAGAGPSPGAWPGSSWSGPR